MSCPRCRSAGLRTAPAVLCELDAKGRTRGCGQTAQQARLSITLTDLTEASNDALIGK